MKLALICFIAIVVCLLHHVSGEQCSYYYTCPPKSEFVNTDGLIHYWPFNSVIKTDHVGGVHISNQSSVEQTNDRFGRPYSALDLNTGYCSLPSGKYFPTGEFTISFWIKPRTPATYRPIIEIGNGVSHNIWLGLMNSGIFLCILHSFISLNI
jgi:hypothetical protein